jgi:hypothetical protein
MFQMFKHCLLFVFVVLFLASCTISITFDSDEASDGAETADIQDSKSNAAAGFNKNLFPPEINLFQYFGNKGKKAGNNSPSVRIWGWGDTTVAYSLEEPQGKIYFVIRDFAYNSNIFSLSWSGKQGAGDTDEASFKSHMDDIKEAMETNGIYKYTTAAQADDNGVLVTGVGRTATEAKNNALQNAVEQIFGVMLTSDTVIENGRLVQDTIRTKAEGYISNYRILSTKQDDSGYRVELRVNVSTKRLQTGETIFLPLPHTVDGNTYMSKIRFYSAGDTSVSVVNTRNDDGADDVAYHTDFILTRDNTRQVYVIGYFPIPAERNMILQVIAEDYLDGDEVKVDYIFSGVRFYDDNVEAGAYAGTVPDPAGRCDYMAEYLKYDRNIGAYTLNGQTIDDGSVVCSGSYDTSHELIRREFALSGKSSTMRWVNEEGLVIYEENAEPDETIARWYKPNGQLQRERIDTGDGKMIQRWYRDRRQLPHQTEYEDIHVLSSEERYTNGGFEQVSKRWWYANGQLMKEIAYKDGKQDGYEMTYYQNGRTRGKVAYKAGEQEGEEIIYNEDGSIWSKVLYKDDRAVSGTCEGAPIRDLYTWQHSPSYRKEICAD